VTEVLFRVDPATEEVYLNGDDRRKEKGREDGPLAGVPVSLKDTIIVKGSDTTVGYSKYVGLEEVEDGAMVKLLREAGAMPFVKTNLPITLLSFESTNDVSPHRD
jgi:Asp-tRNA(Asn)/Glu-tRNA(Gln) amidotransferase A subunit family amidase